MTLLSWMRGLPFAPWQCNIFMIPSHWSSNMHTQWCPSALRPAPRTEEFGLFDTLQACWCSVQVILSLQSGWTNVSLLFNDWDVCRKTTYVYYGQRGSPFYLRESLCRREEELRAPRISLFWKRSVSLSFLDVFFVFVLGWCFLCFGACFRFLPSEDIRLFAFHLFSYNLKIVDRPQDVLMTVRASSAHGMG